MWWTKRRQPTTPRSMQWIRRKARSEMTEARRGKGVEEGVAQGTEARPNVFAVEENIFSEIALNGKLSEISAMS